MRQVNLKETILSHILIQRQKKTHLEGPKKDYSPFNETISGVTVVNNNTLEKNFGGKKSPFHAFGNVGMQDKEDNRSVSN